MAVVVAAEFLMLSLLQVSVVTVAVVLVEKKLQEHRELPTLVAVVVVLEFLVVTIWVALVDPVSSSFAM